MLDLSIPIYYLNKFSLLGGTYESIRTVRKTRSCRFEECKIYVGGKTYTGIIRFHKYSTTIVDILEENPGEDSYTDFLETCERIEKTIPREVFDETVGFYSFIRKIIFFMRLSLLLSFGIFLYRAYLFRFPVLTYVFAVFLIVMVFFLSRPLLIYSTQRL